MKVLFVGASDLGWKCCSAILEAGCDVVGILTAPRDFRISWSVNPVTNVRHRDFADLAAEHNVPLFRMTGGMSDPALHDWVAALEPTLMVVIGWYHIVPRRLRELARLGCVGVHASLLPEYRGGAPLVWAVIRGEKRSGVSLFYFDSGVDTGDIIAQSAFEIAEDDDIAAVVEKSTIAAVELTREYVPRVLDGTAPRQPQDHSAATVFQQRSPSDGLISWSSLSASAAYNWIRAQTRPYPGAFTYVAGKQLTIWRSERTSVRSDLGPGAIVFSEGSVFAVCGDQQLLRIDEATLDERELAGDVIAAELRQVGATFFE